MKPKERLRKNLATLKFIEDRIKRFKQKYSKPKETRIELIDRIVKQINESWRFDNNQQHLSNWHDKQDLLELIEKMKCDTYLLF